MASPIRHADELPYDGTAAGLAADVVQAAIDEVAAASAPFDPDAPLDYFTMFDAVTGDVIEVTIESGAWVLTTVQRRTTEAGDIRTTEDGNVRIIEG